MSDHEPATEGEMRAALNVLDDLDVFMEAVRGDRRVPASAPLPMERYDLEVLWNCKALMHRIAIVGVLRRADV